MAVYGKLCGETLARAHARTGDRIAIASYLGYGTSSTGRFWSSARPTPSRTTRLRGRDPGDRRGPDRGRHRPLGQTELPATGARRLAIGITGEGAVTVTGSPQCENVSTER